MGHGEGGSVGAVTKPEGTTFRCKVFHRGGRCMSSTLQLDVYARRFNLDTEGSSQVDRAEPTSVLEYTGCQLNFKDY